MNWPKDSEATGDLNEGNPFEPPETDAQRDARVGRQIRSSVDRRIEMETFLRDFNLCFRRELPAETAGWTAIDALISKGRELAKDIGT